MVQVVRQRATKPQRIKSGGKQDERQQGDQGSLGEQPYRAELEHRGRYIDVYSLPSEFGDQAQEIHRHINRAQDEIRKAKRGDPRNGIPSYNDLVRAYNKARRIYINAAKSWEKKLKHPLRKLFRQKAEQHKRLQGNITQLEKKLERQTSSFAVFGLQMKEIVDSFSSGSMSEVLSRLSRSSKTAQEALNKITTDFHIQIARVSQRLKRVRVQMDKIESGEMMRALITQRTQNEQSQWEAARKPLFERKAIIDHFEDIREKWQNRLNNLFAQATSPSDMPQSEQTASSIRRIPAKAIQNQAFAV